MVAVRAAPLLDVAQELVAELLHEGLHGHRGRVTERGLTLVPLRAYMKNGRVKMEIGLAKGKQTHDKREAIRKKEVERETRQAMGRRG